MCIEDALHHGEPGAAAQREAFSATANVETEN
jgi:hypothetical protein